MAQLIINPNNSMDAVLKDAKSKRWVLGRLVTVYVNGATVSITIRDKLTGQPLSGVSWPLAMPYVALSRGAYFGRIPATHGAIEGREYTVTISISDGLVSNTWTEDVVAVRRAA